MFYDRVCEDGPPVIFYDPDFPDRIKPSVTWHQWYIHPRFYYKDLHTPDTLSRFVISVVELSACR